MNVRLLYKANFLGINVVESRFYPNNFKVKLSMVTGSDDPITQNVAFERIKFVIKEIFNNGIFVGGESPLAPEFLKLSPTKVIILPELAYDQIIGMALYCKLNAVLNGQLTIEDLQISSSAGENIWYAIDENDEMGNFSVPLNKKKKILPWWHREDLTTYDIKGEVPKFDWSAIDLDWEQVNADQMSVEFESDFDINSSDEAEPKPKKTKKKNKKQSNEIIFPGSTDKNFTPTIVPGGKDTDKPDEN